MSRGRRLLLTGGVWAIAVSVALLAREAFAGSADRPLRVIMPLLAGLSGVLAIRSSMSERPPRVVGAVFVAGGAALTGVLGLLYVPALVLILIGTAALFREHLQQ